MNTIRRRWFWATVIAAAAVAIGASLPQMISTTVYAVQSARATAAAESIPDVDAFSRAFEKVAEAIRPSVVHISAIREVRPTAQLRRSPFEGSPFEEFFGDDFFRRYFRVPPPGEGFTRQGLGSGVIVSKDGYILTNNHVVENADRVTVHLSDDREFDAETVGADPQTDLAVIRIKASDLHPARLGDSDALRIGQWVIAAGGPFGLRSTVTAGIVSATGRARVGLADYEDFIQTDAAINPGNSGGPLVNLNGEVIGINTAIYSRSGGYMGIGFAIPINMARNIMDELIEKGEVVRGWLGVVIRDLEPGLARSFGYGGEHGVLVGDVDPDGPAAEAGLKPGDIILRFDGRRVENIDELRNWVAETDPDEVVDIYVFRDGEEKKLDVRVGRLEPRQLALGRTDEDKTQKLGLSVRNLTPDLAQRLGYEPDVSGVVVTDVEQFGPAHDAGLAVRDVIVSVQGEPVRNVQEFRAALRKHDLKEGVRLRVRKGRMHTYVFLRTE